jgi:hypothetical protein
LVRVVTDGNKTQKGVLNPATNEADIIVTMHRDYPFFWLYKYKNHFDAYKQVVNNY